MRWLVFGMLLISAALFTTPAVAQNAGEFAPTRCPIPIPDNIIVECGYLIVPERHENPDGPTIELAVAIMKAQSEEVYSDPVVYLEGGPGGSALYGLGGWVGTLINRNRDLILVDQRGTGYSWPALFCDVYDYDFDVDSASFYEYEAACAEMMTADDIDLGAYNSAQSARDIKMLVEALGYEQANIYGISYGTRLAMTIMRDVPEIARAVVLDSPYPPQVNGYEMQAINGYNAIDAMLTRCAEDSACGSAFPDLRARFYEWAESGDWVGIDYGDGELLDANGYDVTDHLFDILYDSGAIPYLPLALDNLLNGDAELFGYLLNGTYGEYSEASDYYDALYDLSDDLAMVILGLDDYDDFLDHFNAQTDDQLVEMYDKALYEADYADYAEAVRLYLRMDSVDKAYAYLDVLDEESFNRLFDNVVSFVALGWYDVGDSDAVFNSVTCVEEYPFNDILKGELLAIQIPSTMRDSLLSGLRDQGESCNVWGVDAADNIENEIVHSDLPVLVLAGEFDPITPPNFAHQAMEGLSNAQLFIMPGGGHSVIDAGECPSQIGVNFLDNPASAVDMSCLDTLTIPWALSYP